MENQFIKFNKEFFKPMTSYHIKWFDKEGLIQLDDNRLVSIKLDDIGTRDSYNGYWVEIINKQSGLVHRKFFYFKYHLDFVHRGNQPYFHVWFNSGNLDWYISKPVSTKPMVDNISDFITQFK